MFNFFDTVIEYIKLFFDLIVNTIEMLINLISVLYTSLSSVSVIIGFLPPIISTSAVLVLTICVFNYIVGRANQS